MDKHKLIKGSLENQLPSIIKKTVNMLMSLSLQKSDGRNMPLTKLNEVHECRASFLLIILVVSVSNLHAVFALDILLLDDNARYFAFVTDQYNLVNARSFLGLGRILKWIFVAVFSTYSIEVARLLFFLVYIIPLSLLFYVFNRKYLQLPQWVSLLSAVIINILPNQFLIPAFLDGSYPVPGMLVFIGTLMLTTRYLQSPHRKFFLLVVISIGWLLVCDLIAELGIFLFPVLIYYIHTTKAELNKKLILFITTIVITVIRLFAYFQTIGVIQTNKPVDLPIQDTILRIIQALEWWLPLKTGTTPPIILFALLLAALLIYAFHKSLKTIESEFKITRAYVLYGIWLISCSLPFLFVTRHFHARYLYISFMALTAITLIAIFQLFILPRKNKRLVSRIVLIFIFSLYGTQRYLINKDLVDQWNGEFKAVNALLVAERINADTQIAIVNITKMTAGYYIWSSGYLQYLLKKPGIRGIIGDEMHFYDPFNMDHCSYQNKMSCLDPGKELIAYRGNLRHKSVRMNYFLQWINEGKRDSEWFLYRTDQNNKLETIDTGSGIDAYKATLSRLNLGTEQVFWGNFKIKNALDEF